MACHWKSFWTMTNCSCPNSGKSFTSWLASSWRCPQHTTLRPMVLVNKQIKLWTRHSGIMRPKPERMGMGTTMHAFQPYKHCQQIYRILTISTTDGLEPSTNTALNNTNCANPAWEPTGPGIDWQTANGCAEGTRQPAEGKSITSHICEQSTECRFQTRHWRPYNAIHKKSITTVTIFLIIWLVCGCVTMPSDPRHAFNHPWRVEALFLHQQHPSIFSASCYHFYPDW